MLLLVYSRAHSVLFNPTARSYYQAVTNHEFSINHNFSHLVLSEPLKQLQPSL